MNPFRLPAVDVAAAEGPKGMMVELAHGQGQARFSSLDLERRVRTEKNYYRPDWQEVIANNGEVPMDRDAVFHEIPRREGLHLLSFLLIAVLAYNGSNAM